MYRRQSGSHARYVGAGVFGGHYSGSPETVIMRLTDILMAFPYILLAIAIVAGLGPGLICLGIFGPGKA